MRILLIRMLKQLKPLLLTEKFLLVGLALALLATVALAHEVGTSAPAASALDEKIRHNSELAVLAGSVLLLLIVAKTLLLKRIILGNREKIYFERRSPGR